VEMVRRIPQAMLHIWRWEESTDQRKAKILEEVEHLLRQLGKACYSQYRV